MYHPHPVTSPHILIKVKLGSNEHPRDIWGTRSHKGSHGVWVYAPDMVEVELSELADYMNKILMSLPVQGDGTTSFCPYESLSEYCPYS